jgi:pyruvate formate lyase activating enzyme
MKTFLREAQFYEKLKGKKVKCQLCPWKCIISIDSTGICNVRKNIDGKLYSLVYSRACSLCVDPIEKKPLFHFMPSERCLSLATVGCNLSCSFCQNYEISKGEIFGNYLPPKKIIELAEKYKTKIIAYTYTEPTIFYEYALDIMELAKRKNFKNVWVTNGYTNSEPIRKIAPYLDAVNVDVKGDEQVYKKICKGSLKPVIDSLLEYKKNKIWIEVTSLIIPNQNDTLEWINFLTSFIKNNLGEETPLHLSRFYPHYQMLDTPSTPVRILKEFYEKAKKKLDYVYIGNVFEPEYESTYCPKCGELAIKREGYKVEFVNPTCKKCGTKIAGVYE